MRGWDVLVISITVGVLYLAISWQVRSDQASDQAQNFLTSLEVAVKAIATSATDNYDNACDLRDTCQSKQNCSRRECFPLDGQEFQCVYSYNFTRCNAFPNSQCNRMSADFSRSMLRLPGNETVTLPDAGAETVASVFGTTICTQRVLDATFAAQRFSYSNNYTFFYISFSVLRTECFDYIPLENLLPTAATLTIHEYGHGNVSGIQITYAGAISVKKDVVLLLDAATGKDSQFFSALSPLDIVKNLIRKLGQTLTPKDTFTLISVNSSGAFLLGGPYSVSADASEVDDSLLKLLGNPALDVPVSDYVAPSKFKAGFELANAISPPSNTTGGGLKIILLFTDSNYGNVPPADIVNSTLTPLKNEGVGVFVFDLASGNASSLWDFALCWRTSSESGQQYLSTAQRNPLLLLNPYFSFLARARIKANNESAIFYTKPHNSATDLGRVIAVAHLVMSSDNTVLVGVAGLSVQTGGLPTDFENTLEALLDSESYRRYTSVPTISSFVDPITTCSAEYTKSCPSRQTDSFQPLCYSSAKPASDDELQSLMCCNGEGCSTGHHERSHLWAILSIVWIAVTLILLFLGGCMYIIVLVKTPQGSDSSPPVIPWEELNLATNRFDNGNIIGRGAFGVVYRGVLRGMDVAVKHLRRTPDRSDNFQAELRVNMKITKHRNLVELKGACFRDGDCYLVYELVEGGDLYRWLWPDRNQVYTGGEAAGTSWNQRKQIAHGIAEGLDYLHRGLLPRSQIFHLDLKPRNILLDKTLNPKIADFGISQLYEPGHTIDIANVNGGSFGYMAPEILQGCIFPNTKLDVFSFGVVLMQLVSGRKINDPDLQPSFLQWARKLVDRQDMNLDMVIDKRLLKSVRPGFENNLLHNCRKMIDMAMNCTEAAPQRRPEMIQLLEELANLEEVRELESST